MPNWFLHCNNCEDRARERLPGFSLIVWTCRAEREREAYCAMGPRGTQRDALSETCQSCVIGVVGASCGFPIGFTNDIQSIRLCFEFGQLSDNCCSVAIDAVSNGVRSFLFIQCASVATAPHS
eukprot:4857490-Amphidinium_carterae.2